jgi:hypothetical protein
MCSTNSLHLGDDTIGSPGFIAAATRTAETQPFGGAGLCADRLLVGSYS